MSGKHDGDLNGHQVKLTEYGQVEITDNRAEFVQLEAMQAVKLLAWLEEEYPNLWRLVREKESK